MCLIFISLDDHPTYKLIVAANRDEFYNRKTAAADYWKDYPHILGGRDLEANGTWMGVTTAGRISLLTNYRDPKNINPNAPSRGHLVSDFLEKEVPPTEYMKTVADIGKQYNGFNLLAGTFETLFYFSNYGDGVEQVMPGLHGLSNHLLDTPWPKVKRGKEKLKTILKEKTIAPTTLFEFLLDDQRAADADLPDTGVGLERERALSSMFIKSPGYGSRCSTVLLVDRAGHVTFAERVYDLQTFAFSLKTFEFEAGKSAR
ncbi:MAG TPA: NRDE family protein [Cyclobacteriaceae bacterium]|nr:NRDE family protein [Cyclobacteriaceae bacterium]